MSSSSHDIYETLRGILTERKSNEAFEIEIVSPELGPLVRDGSCIGISKKALAKAFITARRRFTEYLIQRSQTPTTLSAEEKDQDLAAATEIILLFDCEHVTACNWRKRLISSASKQECATIEGNLERERSLMTTFLCSPLHRHTKSPTLWQHRLWILTELLKLKAQQQGATSSCETSNDFLREIFFEEFDVVCKAGQLHPRNYYAFGYMRQVHALMIAQPASSSTKDESSGMLTGSSALSLELALVMIEPMLKWCLSNPSDISGWMYLFYLLDYGDDDNALIRNGNFNTKRKLVMDRTLHFSGITTWEGESLWTFVDLMLERFGDSVLPEQATSDDSYTGIPSKRDDLPAARWQKTMNRIKKDYSGK
ncbi:hypothetical protein UA08_05725 [Talaromyces atroroseus]|uniref:Uncharacterized protein n=1 Tax=Talaromyces atroroseus TaxID=1441469 RepID=A0A225AWY9_TALAT|nr:hypothetical protein UA08_05725 [Talaromyces atroroseus]OKL58965.1 hypothetical protein UA08_05725 [Talaromyces atroroseus]